MDSFLQDYQLDFTINENHNIRASVQTGFRNPTTQDLFIGLDAGRAVLVGSAPDNLDRYVRTYPVSLAGQQLTGLGATTSQTGGAAYTNSFSAASVQAFAASGGDVSFIRSRELRHCRTRTSNIFRTRV